MPDGISYSATGASDGPYEADAERPRAPDAKAEALSAAVSRQFAVCPPISLRALRATCGDLLNAFASGSKRIALVGPPGSGKTYALDVFSRAVPSSDRAKIRTASQPRADSTVLDLVDAVDDAGLRAIASQSSPSKQIIKQIIAIRPQTVPLLKTLMPDVTVVAMRPIGVRDVRTMMEERRKHLRLASGVLTFKALASLERLCEGNPGKLDALAGRSIRIARAASAGRVTAQHVDVAAAELTAEFQAAAAPSPALDPPAPPSRPGPGPDRAPGNVIAFRRAPAHPGPDSAEGAAAPPDPAEDDPATRPEAAPAPGRQLWVPAPPPATPPEHRPTLAASAASAWDRLRQPLPPQEPENVAVKRFDSRALRRNAVLIGLPFFAAVAICVAYAVTWTETSATDQARPSAERIAVATQTPAAPSLPARNPDEIDLQFEATKQPAAPASPSAVSPAPDSLAPSSPPPSPAKSAEAPVAPPSQDTASAADTLPTQLASKTVLPLTNPTPDAGPETATAHHDDQAKAARLLDLAKAMLSIGQTADAWAMLAASAEFGSAEAADLIAARFPAARFPADRDASAE